MTERVDIAIVGAGAAGLMAAIWAGRTARESGETLRIVALDGARTIGAKILVAGGGRCNVTHHAVDERDYAGSTPAAIRRVLRRFPVERTVDFFRELGVELKREETGKLFPVTDRARTVLAALLAAADDAGAEVRHPWRVESIRSVDAEHGGGFLLVDPEGASLCADRVVLATGGCSLPKSGSDGHGHRIAEALGHSVTDRVFPALVPLVLPAEHPLRSLSGISTVARVEVRSGTGRRLHSTIGSVLCTHFGLSGPAILDISRHLIGALASDPNATLQIGWLPDVGAESFDRALVTRSPSPGAERPATPLQAIRGWVPDRLAGAICRIADVDPQASLARMPRDERRAFVRAVCAMQLRIVGDRGFTHAETTAGGVPLAEVITSTMASKRCPRLWLCGEILDVDGRIGGFSFQWAWASGFIAGCSVSTSRIEDPHARA